MNKTFIVFLSLTSMLYSQQYPSWFVDKLMITSNYTCGMVENGYHKDSSFVSAKKNAVLRAVINENSSYILEDIYQSVAGQKAWMDTERTIIYDTSKIENYFKSYFVADSFQTNKFTFVIISRNSNSISGRLIEVQDISQPEWVENIPKSKEYLYSVGVSESYYHKAESWENAEENGRIALAQEISSTSKQIQKKLNSEYSDIVHEIVKAKLYNLEIVSRWVARSTKLHYVLIRMPKG
jgi:hypothetical protein